MKKLQIQEQKAKAKVAIAIAKTALQQIRYGPRTASLVSRVFANILNGIVASVASSLPLLIVLFILSSNFPFNNVLYCIITQLRGLYFAGGPHNWRGLYF